VGVRGVRGVRERRDKTAREPHPRNLCCYHNTTMQQLIEDYWKNNIAENFTIGEVKKYLLEQGTQVKYIRSIISNMVSYSISHNLYFHSYSHILAQTGPCKPLFRSMFLVHHIFFCYSFLLNIY
jgi:hypothetical protein